MTGQTYMGLGGGLYALERPGPGGLYRYWVHRWREGGRLREFGLGNALSVSEDEARQRIAFIRREISRAVS